MERLDVMVEMEEDKDIKLEKSVHTHGGKGWAAIAAC
jgi:hypothetical protein